MWSVGYVQNKDDRRATGRTGGANLAQLWASALAVVALILTPAPGAAQQSDGGDSTASGEQSEEQASQDLEVDPDADNYWSKVREVYTVQKRPFEKVNRLSATVYGGIIPNNIFERYYPVGLRLNYFILENIGLELAGSYAFTADTPLNGVIGESRGAGAADVRVGDSQLAHSNFGIVWSPFYGKSAFYDKDIGYFDLFVMGGVGLAVTQTVPEINAEPETTAKVEGVLGAGMAWYFPDHAAIRLDYRQFVFQKVNPPGGVANPSEISLGASWFF